MSDVVSFVIFGLFIMILAPVFLVGVAIMFGHVLFGKKK